MNKIYSFFLLFSSLAQAQDFSQCGEEASALKKLFTDVEKVRLKCLDDARRESQVKVLTEANELSKLSKQMDEELKKVAIDYDPYLSIVNCKPQLQARCEELVQAKTKIVERMNFLMGWDKQLGDSIKASPSKPVSLTPPCPSKEELDKMKAVRYFHKNLYQTWERCVQINPRRYFEGE